MRSIKVLLISFTLTLVTLFTISSANATPSVKVQHLNVNNLLTSELNHYDIINVAATIPNHLATNYRNSFSNDLLFSNATTFDEKSIETVIDVVYNSNDFFTSTMLFHDKLHQIISYLTTPDNKEIINSANSSEEHKVITQKCNDTLKIK